MHRSGTETARRVLPRAGLALALAVAGQLVWSPSPAFAVGAVFTVSTTADIAANAGACGNTAITSAPSPLSLREATCLANNVGGSVTINIPAGTYNLANGEVQPGKTSGQTVTINGAGAGSTIISGMGASRVLNIDMNSVGGVNANLTGFTVTAGSDSTFGGGGILAGSYTAATADIMTLNSMVVTGNQADVATPGATNQPGGGMQFLGGKLTVTNSTFSNNNSHSSIGSGLFYGAEGTGSPESLTINGSTFTSNVTTNSNGSAAPNGGALALQGATGNYTVTGTNFVNNSGTATTGAAVGAGIYSQGGTLTVTGSTFTGNSVSGVGAPSGGAIYTAGTTVTAHYDRFAGNIGASGSAIAQASGTVDATEDWWGCNAGPGSTGCDTTSGIVTSSPRLVLSASASPATVVGPNATSTISARFTTDSLGAAVGGANLGAFAALPATFSDPPGDATVTLAAGAHTAAFSAGVASIDYHSNTTVGPDPDNVTFDNQTVTATLTVNQPPVITSANTAHFTIGQAGSFTVTSTGYPDAALTESGTLPSGLTFTDNGNGTATLAGTPTGGGGTFPLSLTGNNGISPNATQTLTVSVGQPPAFTSAATATFTVGTAGSFTVTTSGVPTVSTITRTGTLASGLSFTDNGNGTATVAGTPAAGSGGSYPIGLTATNGVSPNATQTVTVQVNQAPAITSNPSDQQVNPGSPVTFTAAASGVPTPTVQWQRSTDGGASYTNIAGATSASYTFTTVAGDDGNYYRAVFTNVAGTATSTAAALSVGTAPAFTSANAATFSVGTAGNFAITTSGVPSATLSRTGTGFPAAWLTLSDNGDGTGSLTGTPPAGSGGSYTFTLKAANGFSPSASQSFTLFVNESPFITSVNHTTFTVGAAGSFAVTTAAGYPTATGISKTGTLPSGVTLTDNGDGTATLAGTPAAGTGESYPITISATATGGTTPPATQSFTLTVNAPPTITSPNHASFATGSAGSFTVTTAAGYPGATTISKTGTLPAGVSFTPHADGTATLDGTPAFGAGGVYTITITASNGIAPNATQSFTLTVNAPPTITSPNHASFTVGAAASFTVTTVAGEPAGTVITATGTPPPGTTFTDSGNGSAVIAGTPTAGGTFTLTVKASNGIAPDATQTLTITVSEPPTITSTDHATFTVGSAGNFTVTTTAGTPAPRTITETGALPSGVTFTDNNNGTATIAGTPAAGTGAVYPITIKADNTVSPAPTQSFTLTVLEPTAISSADHVTFTVGAAGSTFTVSTAGGYPTPPVLSETGAVPTGMTFTDQGDGTATLTGTPSVGGTFTFTITANNGVAPNATQSFTATVNHSPSISSPDHTTFTVGAAGDFDVTTTAGTPALTHLSLTGTLPGGVSFVDNGNGTARISGTPAAGSGRSYPLSITATNGVLPDSTQSFTLTVQDKTAITSPDHATFRLGSSDTFTVTTAGGYPTPPVLSETGTVPTGMTFTDNGDGTATLAGTPTAGGTFAFTITANNGVAPNATQAFTATVNETPTITSLDHATFAAGTGGSFTVTTNPGTPSTTTLTVSGTLPTGVSFVDGGHGSALLSGTPAAGQGGSYSLTITASNNVLPDATQAFTLTVTELPSFTSAGAATFTAGTAGSFTVSTAKGYPAATTFSEAGLLPSGVTLNDLGNGTATLDGTPAAGTGGTYPVTLTATNSAGHQDQSFVLTVDESPAITSPNATTLTAGTAGTFTVTTAGGFPTPPALTAAGTLPGGVSFTDNHNGTATLAGTATSGGVYPLTVTASNGASANATQTFTLTVNGPPSITSAATMTFTAGLKGSFTVTTRAGVPAGPIRLTETGRLPHGVSFVDNHDGTATLAGTATPEAIKAYPLTISASNGVSPDATQHFTLNIVRAAVILPPPAKPPVADGPLHGIAASVQANALMHITGSGYAAGAPVTIVAYPGGQVIARTTADATGHISVNVRVPSALGTHTFVAAGIGANGKVRYLEFTTVVVGEPDTSGGGSASGSSGSGSGGGGLPFTGLPGDPRVTAGFGLAAILAGLTLLVATRRRRRGEL